MNSIPATSDQAPIEPTPNKRRPWRVRWSMRVLVLLVAAACTVCGWFSYQYRTGQLHDDVAKQLMLIQGPVRRKHMWDEFPIEISWEIEETKTVLDPPPEVTAITGATDLTIRYRIRVKHTPRWMEMTSTGPMFQRLKSVHLTGYIHPDILKDVADQLGRLDGQVPIAIEMPRMHQHAMEVVLSKTQVHELEARFAKLEPGPMPFLRDSGLVELGLSHTWFSDAAINDLPDTLEGLDLERTAVTDAGLPAFKRLYRLKHLNLKRTPTSGAAIEKLRQAMPQCNIEWEPLKNP